MRPAADTKAIWQAGLSWNPFAERKLPMAEGQEV
jgi:hypothetical protein